MDVKLSLQIRESEDLQSSCATFSLRVIRVGVGFLHAEKRLHMYFTCAAAICFRAHIPKDGIIN